MRIIRDGGHCPRGERMVRKAARLAGFDGTLELRGSPRPDSDGLMTWGQFDPPEKITLWTPRKSPVDLFEVLAHEWGHWDRHRRGRFQPISNYRNRRDYHASPEERAANRYASRLMRRLGLRS